MHDGYTRILLMEENYETAIICPAILGDCDFLWRSGTIANAGLCHGSAGVAHLFHRLHRATGDAACREAALAWFERCLVRVDDLPNVAGFPTFSFERNRDGEYVEDAGVLTGAAGTGLALLAAISPEAPAWDRFLLTDLDG